jgi:uncharacterized membrane protein YdjX (TVP38/TMEM64 family)
LRLPPSHITWRRPPDRGGHHGRKAITGSSDASPGDQDRRSARALILKFGAVVALLAALVLLWRFTPVGAFASVEAAGSFFESYRSHPAAPVFTVLAFIAGGLVAFPVTIMIVAAAATFGLWPGALYAALGVLASAAVGYGVGHAAGAAHVHGLLGPRARKVTDAVGRRGVLAVMAVRIVPVAPFSIVNVVAGALNIKFADFVVGTVLGVAPAFLVSSLAGDRVSSFVARPTATGAAVLALVLCVWLGLSLALQAAMRRRARA